MFRSLVTFARHVCRPKFVVSDTIPDQRILTSHLRPYIAKFLTSPLIDVSKLLQETDYEDKYHDLLEHINLPVEIEIASNYDEISRRLSLVKSGNPILRVTSTSEPHDWIAYMVTEWLAKNLSIMTKDTIHLTYNNILTDTYNDKTGCLPKDRIIHFDRRETKYRSFPSDIDGGYSTGIEFQGNNAVTTTHSGDIFKKEVREGIFRKIVDDGRQLIFRFLETAREGEVVQNLRELESVFGSYKNVYGYKVIHGHIGIMYDAYICPQLLRTILRNMTNEGYSPCNLFCCANMDSIWIRNPFNIRSYYGDATQSELKSKLVNFVKVYSNGKMV